MPGSTSVTTEPLSGVEHVTVKGPVVRSAVSTPHRVAVELDGKPAASPTHTSNVFSQRWQQSSRLYTTTELTLEAAGSWTDSHGLATLRLEMQKFQPLLLLVTPSMHWAAPKSCPGKLAEERVELIDALTGVMATGPAVGAAVGTAVSGSVGAAVGAAVGATVVGNSVAKGVGAAVGAAVGMTAVGINGVGAGGGAW